MWRCFIWWLLPNVSRQHSLLIFKGRNVQLEYHRLSTPAETTISSRYRVLIISLTHLEERRPHWHRCERPKTSLNFFVNVIFTYWYHWGEFWLPIILQTMTAPCNAGRRHNGYRQNHAKCLSLIFIYWTSISALFTTLLAPTFTTRSILHSALRRDRCNGRL